MVNTVSLSALPMENYVIDGKVNKVNKIPHSHVLSLPNIRTLWQILCYF